MYESRKQQPLSNAFVLRRLIQLARAPGLPTVSLAAGMAGYMSFEKFEKV